MRMKSLFKSNNVLTTVIATIMVLSCFFFIQTASASQVINGKPIGTDQRTLSHEQTGDGMWIEIATNCGYSLIVRGAYVISTDLPYNDPLLTSARLRLDAWYNQQLPSTARLRNYAVGNTALANRGAPTNYTTGWSAPNGISAPTGNDVAFLLSAGEAGEFFSDGRYYNRSSWTYSPAVARKNWAKYTTKNEFHLLRTQDNDRLVDFSGTTFYGTVGYTSGPNRIHRMAPALWVRSTIFTDPIDCGATIIIIHRDSADATILKQETHNVNPGYYGPYLPQSFPGYGPGRLSAGSAPASGIINIGEIKIIIYLYDKTRMTVTYDPNGGTGSINVVPVNPYSLYTIQNQGYTRDGAVFVGWNTMPNGLGIFYSNGQTIYISNSIVLYAQWQKIPPLTVTYHPNGGVGDIRIDNTMPNTDYTIRNPGYTREGAVFIGWNTMTNGLGASYSTGQVIRINTSITLYAQWQKIPPLTVTYHPNGGVGTIRTDSTMPNTDYTIKNPGYTREGAVFVGWNTMSNGSGVSYSTGQVIRINTPITLYAQWQKIPPLTVTYEPNGGIGSTNVYNVSSNSSYTIRNQGYIREGYAFNNWNTKPDGRGVTYIDNQIINITTSVTLYAQWKKITPLIVTYEPNGGIGSTNVFSVNPNSFYTVQNQGYFREGYIFNGWNTNPNGFGVTYLDNQLIYITTSVTLYAQWKLDKRLRVVYEPNGGIGSTNVYYVEPNSSYIIRNQGYTREGYTFTGWNTSPDGKGVNYLDNQLIYVFSHVTLYAQWKKDKVQQATVTYDPNGGTGSIVRDLVDVNTYYTIKDQGYKAHNKAFIGWNSRPDGLGIAYSNNQIIFVTSSITLYANWITTNSFPME